MIEIKNISKTFKNNKVLDGIDLTINQGDVVAIIGPSGTGKSTFLRCVDRLEKPETGTITIDGETQDLAHIHGKDLTELRKKTGMVFQNFNLFSKKTALQNVMEGLIVVKKMPKEQAREIVEYAAQRYITVIPEIDLPGHMLGALAAYPELGCTGGPYEVWTRWGISDNVLCAGNDKTIEFIQDVLSEIIDIFPSEYIHVGGDECPKTQWAKCPKCQAKIKQLGLKSDAKHTKEERLQSYVINAAEKFLNSKGRQMIGWDDNLKNPVQMGFVVTDNVVTSVSYNFVRFGLKFGAMLGIDLPPETFGI